MYIFFLKKSNAHLIRTFFLIALITSTFPISSSEAKKSNYKEYTHLPNFPLTLELATVKFKVGLLSLAAFPTLQRTLSLPACPSESSSVNKKAYGALAE
jgi:hypothetical protein